MNSVWQVARTYVPRIRFWIFGAVFLFTAYAVADAGPRTPRSAAETGMFFALIFGCIFVSLTALHQRRLLSGWPPQLVPGFVGPHLVAGALPILAVCLAVPWLMAARMGGSPLHFVGVFALAGILSGLVLLWPQSILLIALAPVVVLWVALEYPGSGFLMDYFEGRDRATLMAAIVLAAAAYPAAVLLRMRIRDRVATFSDDLGLLGTEPSTGRVRERLLRLRDPVLADRLARGGGPGWRTRRWQLPVIVSWTEWGLLLLAVVVLGGASALITREPSAGAAISMIAGPLILFLPIGGYWRIRCSALAGEFLRPVERHQLVRQFLGGMLWDFAGWTAVATVVSLIGYPYLAASGDPRLLHFCWRHLLVLWAFAIWLYGLSLITIRLRYWVPWFFLLLATTAILLGLTVTPLTLILLGGRGPNAGDVLLAAHSLAFAVVGLAAGAWTYRRWVEMEID